jgi:glycine/D-amino acid oxidase-like deaminating enzyme
MSAFLLAKHHIRVALVFPQGTKPLDSFVTSLGVCWPSLNDPPTRAVVAHGTELAFYLQECCQKGQKIFRTHFLNPLELWQETPCTRWGLQSFEQQELLRAMELGFGIAPSPEPSLAKKGVFFENALALVCRNPLLFQENMLKWLQKAGVVFVASQALALAESQSTCTLSLACGRTLHTELVVLASALNIASLLPRYTNILVPMSDCLFRYTTPKPWPFLPQLCNFAPVGTLRASNGHLAASFGHDNNSSFLNISGPRFLLPGAGAGVHLGATVLQQASLLEKLQTFHTKTLLPFLGTPGAETGAQEWESAGAHMLVDCYPCDELPLVGEFGKFGRILGSTGWLATGLSAGALAAQIMYDLIFHEKSPHLHPRLHPRRFFRPSNASFS